MKVLICDDVPERRNEIVEKIVDAGQPEPEIIEEAVLSEELKTLFSTAKDSVREPPLYKGNMESRFDDVDIVVLDNNLTLLPGEGPLLTAESIAGYIRAFTNAVYIVSLNVNPDVDFDLRYLVGDFSSRTDLALNTEHLGNPALWSGDLERATDGFLPWYWPRLDNMPDRRREQIAFVKGHLDRSVLEAFGFDKQRSGLLSLHARGVLSLAAGPDGASEDGGTPLEELTFRDVFIANNRSIPIKKDRETLSAFEKEGHAEVTELLARVIAADIDLWFRQDVVGPQEPLLDLPHLLIRFPFLLGDKSP